MKITAIINDELIKEAIKYSKKNTVTDTIKTALHEYIRMQKLKEPGERQPK